MTENGTVFSQHNLYLKKKIYIHKYERVRRKYCYKFIYLGFCLWRHLPHKIFKSDAPIKEGFEKSNFDTV